MSDYTKLIVNCSVVNNKTIEDYKAEILENMGGYLSSSAYHCEGELLEVTNSSYIKDKKHISLIAQNKYGRDIPGFLEWLKPQVTQGMGYNDIFAFEISEYENGLTVHSLIEDKQGEG